MRFYRCAVLVFGAAAVAAAQSGANWDYSGRTGPLNWGKLDPAYKACSQGHEQSPIDIRGAHLNKGLQPIEFHYIAGPVTLENTGKSITVHVDPGSYIVADGQRYELQEFHFHHPSEEAVKGKLTDMDVHLVHRSTDGKTAVIAVRFSMDRGDPNAVLAALWPSLPSKAGQTTKIADMIDAGGFLPADRGYWTYTGIAQQASLYRGRTLVCLRRRTQHQPLAITRFHLGDSYEHAPTAGHARTEDRSQRVSECLPQQDRGTRLGCLREV